MRERTRASTTFICFGASRARLSAWLSRATTVTLNRRHAMRARDDPNVATCHCGTIQIRVRQLPRTLTSCNCSICRRYGALWGYYAASSVQIDAPKGSLATYSFNRRARVYHRCKTCGCVTHYTYRQKRAREPIAVNGSNFEPSVIAAARVRRFDGAVSGRYVDSP